VANEQKWERLRKWADQNEDHQITPEEWKQYVVMKHMDLLYAKIVEVSKKSTHLADFVAKAHAELNKQIATDAKMACQELLPTYLSGGCTVS
jgi:hypothetical protein